MQQSYDVVVIGAGSGGLTAAVGFKNIGKSVLLIEREHMGGECTNFGCIPSKSLLHHAKQYQLAKHVAGDTEQGEVYRNRAFAYVRSIVDGILEEETPEVFKKKGIDVVLGEAVFENTCAVRVGDAVYTYKHAVIATGSRPRRIEIPGLREEHTLTNETLFAQEEIPKRLLIIGGGPIGLEMGQAFAMLGSNVTIADTNERFAPLEDESVATILHKKCESLGITLLQNAYIDHVEGTTAHFTIKKGGAVLEEKHIIYDKVLIAIGRVPNLPQGLDDAGIAYNEHGILVDSQYRTRNKYVYALGDVAQKLKFTHTADDSARQVVTRIASKGLIRINAKKAVPKVTYTAPEVAQVGLSYAAACTKYPERELMRIEVPFDENDRAKTDSATAGLLIVTARRLNGAVLGASIIGPSAGELISLFTLSIDRKISMWQLGKLIYPYPTYALIIKKAGDHFLREQISTLKSDILYAVRKHIPKFFIGMLWIFGLWQLYAYKNAHGMDTTETALMIFDFITMTIWGPVLYVLVYAIRPLTFFPATALTILSGIFFGLWSGIVLTLVGANLAAIVAYGTGRFFGHGLSLEDSVIGNWVQALQKHTFSAVLTMRLIFLPFDGVSYVAGVLKATFIPFVGATALGILLGTATFVSIGASLDVETFRIHGFSTDVINPLFLLLSAVIFVVSVVLSTLLKRWKAE